MRKIPIHFILTGGDFIYVYYLAIMSAIKTQDSDQFYLWSYEEPQSKWWNILKDRVKFKKIDRHDFASLSDRNAHAAAMELSDLYRYQVLYEYGGLYMDLDSLCLKDFTKFLDDSIELVISKVADREYRPYNTTPIMCRKGSKIMLEMGNESLALLSEKKLEWAHGPGIVDRIVKKYPDKIKAIGEGIIGGQDNAWGQSSPFLPAKNIPEKMRWLHIYSSFNGKRFYPINEVYIMHNESLYAKVARQVLDRTEYDPFGVASKNLPVHFVLTSKDLIYPYYLCVVSAIKTQNTDIFYLWAYDEPGGEYWPLLKDHIKLMILQRGRNFPALNNKDPHFQNAHIKDLYQWHCLYAHGGLYMDLDCFCLKDVTYMLDDSCEVVAALDNPQNADYPYHIGVVMAKRNSQIMKEAIYDAEWILKQKNIIWGDTGPKLFSILCKGYHEDVKVTDQGILGGYGHAAWGSGNIYSAGGEIPETSHILHLYAGANRDKFFNIDEKYIAKSDSQFAQAVRAFFGDFKRDYDPLGKLDDSEPVDRAEEGDLPIHFVSTGKTFPYLYYLGIMTAYKVYGDRVVLSVTQIPESPYFDILRDKIKIKTIDNIPEFPALSGHDERFRNVAIFDQIIWNLVYSYGGMIMGLDSLTIKPHDQLLESEKEMGIPIDHDTVFHFSMHGVVARKGSEIARQIAIDSLSELNGNNLKWGDTGIKPFICHAKLNIEKTTQFPIYTAGGRQPELFSETGRLSGENICTIPLYQSSMEIPEISPEYISKSQSPYASIIRNILDESEWKPKIEEKNKPDKIIHLEPKIEGQKRFHLLGLPHVPTTKGEGILACAFTQKVIKMAKMLKMLGHTVFFYGVEGSDVRDCDELIQVSTQDVIRKTYGDYDRTKETYRHSNDNLATKTFNENGIREIRKRLHTDDYLLVPFSPQVYHGTNNYPGIIDTFKTGSIDRDDKIFLMVESGIGYLGIMGIVPFMVFESNSLMHYCYGWHFAHHKDVISRGRDNGYPYHVVIPNYFDPADFEFNSDPDDYFLYMGRIIRRKGIDDAIRTVEAIGAKLVVAGQHGEDVDVSSPSVEFVGYANVAKRKNLMSKAKGLFLLTRYIEPFGGTVIEANMSGTPAITSNWGAFTETVLHGQTGWRCNLLDDAVFAANNIDQISREYCREYAMNNYTLERISLIYEEYFDKLMDIKKGRGFNHINSDRPDLDWQRRYI